MHNSNDSEQPSEHGEANVLRIAKRVIETTTPPESYWPGYHARLREKLDQSRQPQVVSTTEPSWIARLFRASVSIPVPVAVALLLVFMLSLFLVRRTPEATPPQVHVVQVPVEVPVQVPVEKIVTRVVYRPTTRKPKQGSSAEHSNSTFAKTLSGFKPTEEIKLTVIKGGANEK